MFGVNGKIIEVNLKRGDVQVNNLPQELFREYLGGYGIGVRLLLDKMDPAADPLGPGNILGLACGYLTGTGAIAADRYMAFGKSPSTGGWGDANSGGYFGRRMKEAGADVILFSEISSTPVYLFVEAGKADLRDAEFLWGKDCYETDDILKEIHGDDCEVSCIGVSGENLSMIAGISTDKGRMAARSALGAVMGSKKVKAVVVKGKSKIRIADEEAFKASRKSNAKEISENPFGQGLKAHGTAMFYQTCVNVGDAPIKNWSGTAATLKTPESISEESMAELADKNYRCSSCTIGCGGHERITAGKYQTKSSVHKVEYESMGMLGSNILNESPESLVKLNDLCNRFGMDTIGCGGLCAYAIECFEKGYISATQTGGLELKWGDLDCIIELVEQIGEGKGIGAVLAQGFDHAIEVFGAETAQYAMAIRNEALPAHDPRWSAGLALTYYSDPTPARHTQGSTTFPVAGYSQPEMTNDDLSGRAKYHKDNVNLVHALSCAGLCTFCFSIIDYRKVPGVLAAVDGTEWTEDQFKNVGFRIFVLRHLFNLKAGINFKDFDFPKRVLGDPPLAEGPTKDVSIDLELLVDEYLAELGFDQNSTQPSEALMRDLNIMDFAP